MERALTLIERVVDESGGSFSVERCTGAVRLNRVHVTYPNAETSALSGVSLQINPGEFIALIGLSGSGKSTLAQLLTRFVDYDKGEVYLDDVELRKWDIQSLRRQFAFVGQNVVMINDSILNNVVLGQSAFRGRTSTLGHCPRNVQERAHSDP